MPPSTTTTTNNTPRKRVYSGSMPTPQGKILFPYLAAPDTEGQFADGKFKATLVIPKGPAVDKFIMSLYEFAAANLPCGRDDFIMPVRDGALRTKPDPDNWYLSAKSKHQPKTVGPNLEPIDPAEIVSGSIVRLAVLASPYTMQQTMVERGRQVRKDVHGITLYLQAVQLVEKAQRSEILTDPVDALRTFND